MLPKDNELLETASELLARIHVPGRHEVAAVLRTRSGALHTGIHLEGSARRSSICAEGIALGAAFTAEDREIETILAVHYKPAGVLRVIAPCGVCRELLYDYCPDAHVYVYEPAPGELPDGTVPGAGPVSAPPGGVARVTVADLLPSKTRRRW
ncbi:CMP/dCMP deaminase zinc-binding protein [Actinobacteria bacterium OK074]|nr:CMP/dCMP deaminase zinc-binding protein [Actinobacteria bacterium OK074]